MDEDEYARWREAAQDALEAARDNAAQGWHNWTCMIAEQAAQLGVKGLLHAAGRGDLARGHDLVRQMHDAHDAAALVVDSGLAAAGGRLARHYQPSRYPDALPGGTPRSRYLPEDAAEALGDAALVLAAVDAAKSALDTAAEGGAS